MSLISSKLTATERIALKNKIIMGVLKKEKNKTEEQGEKVITIDDTVNAYSQGNSPIVYPLYYHEKK